MMHIDGCQLVLYVEKQVKRSERGVGEMQAPQRAEVPFSTKGG